MTKFLTLIFLNKKRITLEKNVRLQNINSIQSTGENSHVYIGEDSIIYENAKIESHGSGLIKIGSQSILGDIRIYSRYQISIGHHFLSSWNVFIQDYDPHPVDAKLRESQIDQMTQEFWPRFQNQIAYQKTNLKSFSKLNWNYPGDKINIGNNVWVGANVTILKGAHIGNNCIIGSSSVVTKGEYPDNSLIAGNPARVIKCLIP